MKVAEAIVTLSNRLAREVEDQQQLTLAERGDLVLHPEKIAVSEVFTILESIFLVHGASEGECFHIERVDPHEKIVIDSSLLIRVLTNMIKNALEEVETGESIRVWFEHMENTPVFHVWNPGVIPERDAIQIFQRSFSTKCERGRGLGTYSMKLFGERYLGGEVSFESTEETGTVFSIRLPADGPTRKDKGTPS